MTNRSNSADSLTTAPWRSLCAGSLVLLAALLSACTTFYVGECTPELLRQGSCFAPPQAVSADTKLVRGWPVCTPEQSKLKDCVSICTMNKVCVNSTTHTELVPAASGAPASAAGN